QLLEKDIPLVKELTGSPDLRAVTVKGQQNYLCLRKLNDLLQDIRPESPLDERWAAAYLSAFASVSSVGELDRISHYLTREIPALGRMIDHVQSHFTTTVGPGCPFYREC